MAKAKSAQQNKKRLVLFDAHGVLHRAYHALPDFFSSKGEPTGGLYGLATMVLKTAEDLKPDYMVACYDLPQATYRHEAYKDYKAGRKKASDDLVAQMKSSRRVFEALSIPMYDKPGFEADDMLGTICELTRKDKDLEIVISSGDMDTLQLVEDGRVQVYTLKKGIKDTILYDEAAVKERYGFGPEHLTDYKGLRGDPSDNIIGVRGIGEKTATNLIQTFGTIEEMYKVLKKNPEELKKAGLTDRLIKILEENEEEAMFSKMLATIRRDAPITFTLPEKEWKETVSIDEADKLFKELEFRAMTPRLKAVVTGTTVSRSRSMDDYSDDGLDQYKNGEVTLTTTEEVDPKLLKETALALWVVDSNISDPQLEDILRYADTNSFSAAREKILGDIEKRNLKRIYTEIELPLIPILEAIHTRGIKIDAKYFKELSVEYHKELDQLQADIWKAAGEEFNINSPRQLGVILFDKLQLTAKGLKKTAGGAKSTRESELEKLKDAHPVVGKIMEYREFQKLLSTYIDTIPNLLEEDGRLHTTFVQTGTTTGRMSSLNPNLQNIPIKSELGRRIRKGFVAEKGFKLVAFDYSQIELRLAAILSGDEKLMDIFKSGRDVHTEVAAQVFKVPADQVDKEMRRKAKVINFGILYGMGVNALRQNLGGTRDEAQTFYNEYFATFTGLADYLEQVKKDTAKSGFTTTLFGRRRSFEGINSKIPYIKAAAERMAINAPIQGTQADMIKLAMIAIDKFIQDEELQQDAHLLLQVHDELIYEIKEEQIKKLSAKIIEVMQSVLSKDETKGIPIIANCAAGKSWGEMESQ